MENNQIDFKKYILVLLITGSIFGTAIYISNYLGEKKIAEIKNIQDKIAIDILSSETQFALLEDSSCQDISSNSLSDELSALEERLSSTEKDRGDDDKDIVSIKKYYSLLQIKDYLLMKKIAEKCKTSPASIIYFYSNNGECKDCQKMGYILTKMREDYPKLRVYAFDYNLEVGALKTLINIHNIKNNMPALIINDKVYYGFQNTEDLEKKIPQIKIWKLEVEKNATSSKDTKN